MILEDDLKKRWTHLASTHPAPHSAMRPFYSFTWGLDAAMRLHIWSTLISWCKIQIWYMQMQNANGKINCMGKDAAKSSQYTSLEFTSLKSSTKNVSFLCTLHTKQSVTWPKPNPDTDTALSLLFQMFHILAHNSEPNLGHLDEDVRNINILSLSG